MKLKSLFSSSLITLGAAILFAGLTSAARAAVIQLTPFGTTALSTFYIDKNGTGPGNGNDSTSQLYRLNTYFVAGPDLVLTDSLKPADQTNVWTSGLAQWDYAVVHFGAGAFGGEGGSVGAWNLNGADAFSFPVTGFSSIDFFRTRQPGDNNTPGVPDGGATVVLLGLALAAIGLARRSAR